MHRLGKTRFHNVTLIILFQEKMKRKTKSKYDNNNSYYYLVIDVKINGV